MIKTLQNLTYCTCTWELPVKLDKTVNKRMYLTGTETLSGRVKVVFSLALPSFL